MMKKLTVIVLALAMILSLAACGNDPVPTAPPTNPPKTTEKPAETTKADQPAPAQTTEAGKPAETTDPGAAIQKLFDGPALVTTAGQSADGTVAETLLTRAGVECDVVGMAGPDDLADHNCLVLVAGGSSKGLGQAGIKEEQELARVRELIDAAKAKNIPILAMHVGGTTRRGNLSDKFIPDAMEACDAAIIVREGDEDGLMKNILEKNGTPYVYIEKQKDGTEVVKQLFGK